MDCTKGLTGWQMQLGKNEVPLAVLNEETYFCLVFPADVTSALPSRWPDNSYLSSLSCRPPLLNLSWHECTGDSGVFACLTWPRRGIAEITEISIAFTVCGGCSTPPRIPSEGLLPLVLAMAGPRNEIIPILPSHLPPLPPPQNPAPNPPGVRKEISSRKQRQLGTRQK